MNLEIYSSNMVGSEDYDRGLEQKKLFEKAIRTQYALNADFIGEDWVLKCVQGTVDYVPPMLIESSELLESFSNWKFWKPAKAPNISNARLELVDILHFLISHCIFTESGNPESLEAYNIEGKEEAFDSLLECMVVSLEGHLEDSVSRSEAETAQVFEEDAEEFKIFKSRLLEFVNEVTSKDLYESSGATFSLGPQFVTESLFETFWPLCSSLGLNVEGLFNLYFGKVALNKFRIAKGQSQGNYIKVWSGLEDNSYLMAYLEEMRLKGEVSSLEDTTAFLEKTYAEKALA